MFVTIPCLDPNLHSYLPAAASTHLTNYANQVTSAVSTLEDAVAQVALAIRTRDEFLEALEDGLVRGLGTADTWYVAVTLAQVNWTAPGSSHWEGCRVTEIVVSKAFNNSGSMHFSAGPLTKEGAPLKVHLPRKAMLALETFIEEAVVASTAPESSSVQFHLTQDPSRCLPAFRSFLNR